MRYFSTFSGIGGFEYGIQRVCFENKGQSEMPSFRDQERFSFQQFNNQFNNGAKGLSCIGYSEIDKYARRIYEKYFPGHKYLGDITKINTAELSDFDLLVGGFPCQAFSIAGKRGGFSDTRGTLFFEIARILKDKRPRYFLLENVKGLLSHESGKTFQTILEVLSDIGYILQWEVLNSKNYGVPQNRERVFIIGHFRGERRPEVFPIGKNCKKNDSIQSEKNKQGAWISCLNTRYGQRWVEEGYIASKQSLQQERIKPNNSNSIRRATYSYDTKIRRLTPTECERLQGFPDGWTEGVSDSQRYKMLGNAVTTNVVTTIAERLIEN